MESKPLQQAKERIQEKERTLEVKVEQIRALSVKK